MKENTKWGLLIVLLFTACAIIITTGIFIWNRSQGKIGIPLNREKEEILRKRLEEDPKSIFIFDPHTSYRLKPSFTGLRHDSTSLPHVTNSLGILGKNEINPDPTVKKFIFLGDSVAYGEHIAYEDVFVNRMADMVENDHQLLNSGCPGWSTHQELAAFQNYFSHLPIDTVVIIFTLNDLLRFEWVWRDENSFQMSAELRGLGGLTHSKLTAGDLRSVRSRFWKNPKLRPLAELNNTCLSSYLPEKWAEWCNLVQPDITKVAKQKRLIIAAVPARPQLLALNQGGDPDVVLFPQHQLQLFCSENGIQYVNLIEAFKKGDNKYASDLFLHEGRGTLHLSPAGHQRVAEYLLPIIFPAEK